MEIAPNVSYTRRDYEALPEGAPYQLIEGKLVMSPAPTVKHQVIIGRLHILFHNYVAERKCGIVLLSPVDVYLSETNAFQPDLVFVSNERMAIVGDRIEGAPDLVVEILSPSTARYDLNQKKKVYEVSGIREYWIVDPTEQRVEVYVNEEQAFVRHARIESSGDVESALLEGLVFDTCELWRPIP